MSNPETGMTPERWKLAVSSGIGLVLILVFSATMSIAGGGEGHGRQEEDPEAIVAAIAQADKMMSSVRRSELETRHFRIATDILDDEVLPQLAASLEGTYFAVDQVLGLPLGDTDRKVRVYCFDLPAQHYMVFPRLCAAWVKYEIY